MLVKYFKQSFVKHKKWWLILALPMWVYGVFMVVQVLVAMTLSGIGKLGIDI